MAHAERYQKMIAHLDRDRQTDGYYTAACYLLSYKTTIAQLADHFVGYDGGAGINFPKMLRAMKDFDENDRIVVDIAYSLFGCRATSKVTPHDMAALPCPWPELIANAMFLSQGHASIVLEADSLSVNYAKYRQTRNIIQEFGEELPQERATSGLHNLCESAKEKATARNQNKTAEATQQEGILI
jgi:hypothetical protein